MAELIVFDMEWNMGYQPKHFDYKGTQQLLRGEIIQIGAVRMVDGQLKERFSINLKPRIFPKLHHHVAKVTGLTQADLENGVPIREGLQQFMDWCVEGAPTYPLRRELLEKQKETVEAEIAHMNKVLDMLRFRMR